jgi:hypothetical protein
VVVRCEGTADVKHQVFSRADKESDRESLSAVIDTETEGSGDFVVFVIILRMETRESGCCRSGPVDTVLQIPLSGRELVLQVIDIRAVSGDVRRIVVNIPAVRRNVRRIVLNLDIGFVELGPIDRLVRRRRNGAGSYICDPPLSSPAEVIETVPEEPPVIVTPFVLMTVVVGDESEENVALCISVRSWLSVTV